MPSRRQAAATAASAKLGADEYWTAYCCMSRGHARKSAAITSASTCTCAAPAARRRAARGESAAGGRGGASRPSGRTEVDGTDVRHHESDDVVERQPVEAAPLRREAERFRRGGRVPAPTEGPHHRSIHGAPRARAATSSAWAAAAWRSEQTSDGQPCGASHRRATEREASEVLYDANGVPAVAGWDVRGE